MVEASHARPHAGTAVPPPSGPPVRALGPALRPLPPSQPPPRPESRRWRPLRARQRRPYKPWSMDAPSSSPAPPSTVSLALRSVPAPIGVVYAVLGWSEASLDVGPLPPRELPRGRSDARERGSREAKKRSGEGWQGAGDMLASSSWLGRATESRSPVAGDRNIDPDLAPRVIGASWKVLRAARLQAREANALDSTPQARDS